MRGAAPRSTPELSLALRSTTVTFDGVSESAASTTAPAPAPGSRSNALGMMAKTLIALPTVSRATVAPPKL